MSEQRFKKDDFQKALTSFNQAMKEFHKGEYVKTAELLEAFLEKHPTERELADRAKIYIAISKNREKKETVHLKGFEDYYHFSVYRINKGDYEGALKLLEKALEMKTEEGKVFYLMADAYCLMGQHETSMEFLKKAIQKDKFFRILAQNEGDFEPLWEDKKFKLITRMT